MIAALVIIGLALLCLLGGTALIVLAVLLPYAEEHQ